MKFGRKIVCRCVGRVLPTPLRCQITDHSVTEDGLAETFEDGGHAVQAFAAGVHAREERVQLVGDALLFVEGRDRHLVSTNIFRPHRRVERALYQLRHALDETLRPHKVEKPTRLDTVRSKHIKTGRRYLPVEDLGYKADGIQIRPRHGNQYVSGSYDLTSSARCIPTQGVSGESRCSSLRGQWTQCQYTET
jgi:hypothetical protein